MTANNRVSFSEFHAIKVSLLKYQIVLGNTALENPLKIAPSVAAYTSKTTQDELLDCCGANIQEKKARYSLSLLCEHLCMAWQSIRLFSYIYK